MSETTRTIIDTLDDRPADTDTNETSDAKNIVAEIVRDAYERIDIDLGVDTGADLGDDDPIGLADAIVEALIVAGWRPTGVTA